MSFVIRDQVEEEGVTPAVEEVETTAEELVVELDTGEEEVEEEASAPVWVKEVRKQNRQLTRELREVRQQLNAAAVHTEPILGPKPTLEAADFDTTKYETELAKWFEAKKAVDEVEVHKKNEEQTQVQVWQSKIAAYGTAKIALNAADFTDAEAVVTDLLNTVQQSIIVSGAKDPALVVYALGKNEKKAKELAGIKDPVEFAFAVARLEAQMKVTGKKPATQPEGRVTSNATSTGTVNSVLEKLRTEAAKTGDYTKVNAYKSKTRQK